MEPNVGASLGAISPPKVQMIKSLYKLFHPRYQTVFLDYKVDLKPRYGHGRPPHRELHEIINANRDTYKEHISVALGFKEQIWNIKDSKREQDSSRPAWNNGFLPGLDIVGLYTMISKYKPSRYIEIGSGNSTKVAHLAIADQGLQTQIVSIDPHPRVEVDNLADVVVREPLEHIDLNLLHDLKANDILFVDNSHRILPNSDAAVFFLDVLPKLKEGVMVQVHDIYLPYDYPQFMCDRFYSEQYGLAMYLLANAERYETILPNYFISEDEELSGMIAPIWEHENLRGVECHGGSFWFSIRE
ncbi:MAG: class I SAM-dependent methyltransferase [Salibacteraceae bacterium]